MPDGPLAPALSGPKVLKVIGSLRPGGAETYVANVTPALRRLGIDVDVCALEKAGPLLGPLEADGVRVYDTPFPRAAGRGNVVKMLRTIDAIRRIVAARGYEIVHTYLFSSDLLGVTGARLAGCRRIIISRQAMHGWVHEPRAFLHTLEQGANLLANEVVACSRIALDDAVAHEPTLPRIRTIIYNAVDTNAYEPVHPKVDGTLRLVTVGALANRKGQEYAIEAMGQVKAAGVDVTLELVGAGPDEAMLRELVARRGLERVVTFAGQQNDPRRHLGVADVFLLPSRQEGFSVALLEAMASSMPAIVTDVGGNAEALVDGDGGRVVPPLDPAAISRAVVELARRRGDLPAMGRFNRKRVVELFSIEAAARRLAEWYRSPSSSS